MHFLRLLQRDLSFESCSGSFVRLYAVDTLVCLSTKLIIVYKLDGSVSFLQIDWNLYRIPTSSLLRIHCRININTMGVQIPTVRLNNGYEMPIMGFGTYSVSLLVDSIYFCFCFCLFFSKAITHLTLCSFVGCVHCAGHT